MNPVRQVANGIFYLATDYTDLHRLYFVLHKMTEYFKIGKLVAVFGLKGELLLKHELGKKTSLKGLQAIFIEEKKNSFLPWFIESTKIKSEEEVYLKLEGVNTREAAINITQKEIWVTETDFKKFAAKTAPVNLLGYMIINSNEPLGVILELIEQPHQLLCRIEIKGKEVLIPLHAESLQKINHKKKEVLVELPDGLLEIYL
jgi:16S rRNA processing protein RimM